MKYPLIQTEEERQWFAEAFERKNQIEVPAQRKIDLANLMLRCQVGAFKFLWDIVLFSCKFMLWISIYPF